MKLILLIIGLCFLGVSCIKQVDVPLRNAKPILVVEGSITTDTVPYTVKLTYSGPFTSATEIPDQYLEQHADVSIADDLGNSTSLTYTGAQGVYQTTDPAYIGQAGRSYHVVIQLPDGKKYISKPELIQPAVPIVDIHISFNSDFNVYMPSRLRVAADIQDPGDEENYYKWNFYSYFLRKTRGIGCGFGCVMYEYCFQKLTDKETRIFSDNAINGNSITDQLMGYSYIYTYGKHYVNIDQLSLTREAYQFWEKYNEQQTRTGSTLDPLPASIKGNVFNEADPADIALGYFSASAVTRRRAVLIPLGITQYLLDISAVQFIPPGENVCFEFFPDALSYPPPPASQYPPPPGWENADTIQVRWQYP